jgi:hypothetical protein
MSQSEEDIDGLFADRIVRASDLFGKEQYEDAAKMTVRLLMFEIFLTYSSKSNWDWTFCKVAFFLFLFLFFLFFLFRRRY